MKQEGKTPPGKNAGESSKVTCAVCVCHTLCRWTKTEYATRTLQKHGDSTRAPKNRREGDEMRPTRVSQPRRGLIRGLHRVPQFEGESKRAARMGGTMQ
jgi:hypothetical protein